MSLDREDWKMIRVGAIFIAAMLLLVFAVLAVAGCGGSAAAQHAPATTPPPPVSSAAAATPPPSAPGAAFCASLKAAPDPLPVYLNAVIDRDNLISSFSTASPDVIERAARAEVAGWIAISCPQFTYLTKGG